MYYLCTILIFLSLNALADSQTICYGQDFVLEHTNTTLLLSQLQDYFSNCEYVYDNLEIVFPETTYISVEFATMFSSIREIKGYLLLENIKSDDLIFSNLTIIRGASNFTQNNTPNALVLRNTIINRLVLPNLKEITEHGVYVYNSQANISTACNLHGVNWTDILNTHLPNFVNLSPNCPQQNCTACQPNYCWTPNDCQRLTLVNCMCSGTRCLSGDPSSCCDDVCSGGCEGTVSTCNACFFCQDTLLPISMQCRTQAECMSPTSDFLLTFVSPTQFSDTCNFPLVRELDGLDFCRLQCTVNNLMCIEGAGSSMQRCRNCQTMEDPCTPYSQMNPPLPALNVPIIPKATCGSITSFKSIILKRESFDPTNPITPSYLSVFENLRELTGYLVIEGYPSFYGEAFSFLSQLSVIRGNELYMGQYALYIKDSAFRQIDLRSLESIEQGSVLIENNTELCYLPTSSGFETFRSNLQISVQNLSTNCPCHSNCEQRQGCWGPSNSQCIECASVMVNDSCEVNCDSSPGTYANLIAKICSPCDSVCIGCIGSATNCTECRISFNGDCVGECPRQAYQVGSECFPCSGNCETVNVNGPFCTGPTDNFGLNGCTECKLYQFNDQNITSVNSTNITSNYTCVSACTEGSYPDSIQSTVNIPQCRPCHPACSQCTGPDMNDCGAEFCTRFFDESDGQCVLTCPNTTYFMPTNVTCRRCDDNCIGCTGDSNRNCTTCKNFRRGEECVSSCGLDEFTNGTNLCQPCNALCRTCENSRDNCTSCAIAAFFQNGTLECRESCPSGYYNAPNRTCLKCNRECFECDGALDTDCMGCRNFELLPALRCVRECPISAEINNVTKTCTISSTFLQTGVIAGIGIGVVLLIGIAGAVITAILIGTICSRRYKKKRTVKQKLEEGTLLMLRERGEIHRTVQGMPEFTLLGYNYETLASVTPAGFALQTMDQSALVTKERLGKGLNGYVYASHCKQKLGMEFPVAVKTFYEVGLKSNFETEFTHAIRDMARISHSSLIEIFGYNSARPNPFIISQLLIGPTLHKLFSQYPGSINEDQIIVYITQITDGMWYLESQKLVYGILTSRNIILANQDQIKLTDYFLHRFSDPIPENALDLPIPDRWMSPELAINRVPTHKSDIWCYGVVIWEMLSFAQLPYNNIADDDVISVLQQGKRLSQPKACTVDLYGFLLQCFIFEATGRPTFSKLQLDLMEMAKTPLKYISIQQDIIEVNIKGPSRIGKDNTFVVKNQGANGFATHTQEARTTEEPGSGEYVDEEEVNKNIDTTASGDYQTAPLINTEYSLISEPDNSQVVNEYEPNAKPAEYSAVDSIAAMQFPLFVSTTPLSSFGTPDMISPKPVQENPYEPPGIPITPISSFFSPYIDSDFEENLKKKQTNNSEKLIK